jgi:hypothetical protein
MACGTCEFGLLPRPSGFYRKDHSKHMGEFGGGWVNGQVLRQCGLCLLCVALLIECHNIGLQIRKYQVVDNTQ